MVKISQSAINDIATFYANVQKKYPNTWSPDMVNAYIAKVMKAMESVVIGKLQGKKVPLLKTLNDGETAEFHVKVSKSSQWYFTLRLIDGDFLIENAWNSSNASNMAFRRGHSNPNAEAGMDDRGNQKRLKEEKLCQENLTKAYMDEYRKTHNILLHEDVNGNKSYTMKGCEMREMMDYVNKRLNEEYKVIATNEKFHWPDGREALSLLTLSDGYGLFRVTEDDGCYVLNKKMDDGDYVQSDHIFPEAFNAMKEYLPKLPIR